MITKRKRIFSRIVSVLLVASVILTSNSIVAMAENIQEAEQESSVIEISSAKDLQKVADDLAGDYVLTEDIDLSDLEFTPIGNNTEPFTGTFDGDGHIISNLDISVEDSEESSFTGLFGILENATVRNLALENCIVTSETTGGIYAGIIAGKMKNSLVEDVYVSGQIDIKEKSAYSLGGIVGAVFQNRDDETQALEYNMARCIVNVLINVPKNANGEKGALVGYVEDTALVENSYSFISDAELFGVEVDENNSCKVLNENTWSKENSYIGFDFENVWKITDGGARLFGQTYEKSEEIVNSPSGADEETEVTEVAESPEIQKATDQPNTKANSEKDSEAAREKASKSISKDDVKMSKGSNDVGGGSDNGIMLLASDLTSGNFTYTVSGNNATITGYTGSGGSVVIPSKIGEYTVIGVGNNAFYDKEAITAISLPETITSLGSCFIRGTGIKSITIPKNVTDCGSSSNGPLAGSSVTEVVFEEGIKKIPNYACSTSDYSSYIEKVTIPEGVTEIGAQAFYCCEKITSVNIPKTVSYIGGSAFAGCQELGKVILNYNDAMVNTTSNGTQLHSLEIENFVFGNCSKLSSINLTENVTSIGSEAFRNCTKLESLILPERVTSIGSCFIRGTGIKSITIPKNVTDCGSSSNGPLAGSSVTEVVFEEGIKKIPNYACSTSDYSSYIEKVTIPEGVTEIGAQAFYCCEKITSVNIPKTVSYIGGSAFAGCQELGKVILNYNDAMVNTTSNGTQLHSLEIENFVFGNCSKLSSINLTENVTSIGSEAFRNCTKLESLILPERVTSIGSCFIRGTGIKSITIPKNVTECGSSSNGPLAGSSVTEVIFEEGIKKIPDYACSTSSSYSSYITKVIIPETVTDIGSNAFYNCNNMTIYGYKNSYAESYAITESIPFVSVAIAKNASADDVLKKMNLDTLVNNISFAGTDISGPTVTIAGKTFSLFSVPASMDIKLGDKVQAKVDDEKKTIQVLIGFDDFSGSAKLDPSENSTAYWSESYKQVKSLYTGVTGNKVDSTKLWNQFSKLRGRLKKMDCSMGINASASAAGYIEFSYASGEITYSSGGVILEANLGTSLEYKLPPCPAVYVTFGVEAGFNGKLSLVRESSMNYTPAMHASIDLSAFLGVGAGTKKGRTYAEFGLKGKLGMDVSLPADSLSDALLVNLTAYAYFDSKVFGFNGPNWGPEEFAEVQLYPGSRRRSLALFGGRDLADFDLDSATSCDRTYLNAPAAQSLETENV